jgi:hypothetical protein
MYSPLEDYLEEIAAQLGSLPKPRRDDEIKEVRAHLACAIAANEELGASESDAVQMAMMEFGRAKSVAESILWAWRRFVRKQRLSWFYTSECMWSAYTAYQIFANAGSPIDQQRWLQIWVFHLSAHLLLLVAPQYWPKKGIAPTMTVARNARTTLER